MASEKIDISIIIPVKNGGALLDRVLTAVFNQQSQYGYEVIVIDSGSDDDTMDIIKRHPVRLYEIPPEEFSHSKTRNLGASFSRAGRYLVFLNQDAVPTDEYWLNNLVKSIEYEPDLKAACATELIEGRQPFNIRGSASYVFINSAAKGIYVIEPKALERFSFLPGQKQRRLFPFTTVCAIFDKSHFEEHPFNEDVVWGEDLHWAVDNSNAGYKSACSLFAQVYHCHPPSREKRRKDGVVNTAKLYMDLFNVSNDGGEPRNNDTKQLHAIRSSYSWRITAPLRAVLRFLRREQEADKQ